MDFNFDQVTDRQGTYSMKYDDDGYFDRLVPGIRLDDDSIRLMIADTDFRCAPSITRAMHRVADFPTFGYTTPDAAPGYKPAIIHWYQRRFGYEVRPEWIIHASGALDGVGQTIQAFSNPGDGVIICSPVYSNFTSTILRLHRRVVNCQLIHGEGGDYRIDWEAFEKCCAEEDNKVYVLCSPENPIGRVWKAEALRQMADICRENGVVLVSDEIHCDIVRKGVQHLPILKAVQDHSNLIMVGLRRNAEPGLFAAVFKKCRDVIYPKGFLENQVYPGSYEEEWSLKKILRRFTFHGQESHRGIQRRPAERTSASVQFSPAIL